MYECHKCGSSRKFHDCPGQETGDLMDLLSPSKTPAFSSSDGDSSVSDDDTALSTEKDRKIRAAVSQSKPIHSSLLLGSVASKPKQRKRTRESVASARAHNREDETKARKKDSRAPNLAAKAIDSYSDSDPNLPMLGYDEVDDSYTDNSSLVDADDESWLQKAKGNPRKSVSELTGKRRVWAKTKLKGLPKNAKKSRAKSIFPSVKRTQTTLCQRCNVPTKDHVCPFEVKSLAKENPQWTTAMAPMHMLKDQLYGYLQDHKSLSDSDDDDQLGDDEKRFLQGWAQQVCKKLSKQDELVRQNILLVTTQKQQATAIRSVQNELVALQGQIRRVHNDTKIQEEEVRIRRRENDTYAAACRFLRSLD